MLTRLAGGESAAITNGQPGSFEVANPFPGDVKVTHLCLIYPGSTYDTSLVTKIEETSSQVVYLSGEVQYKAIGERAGIGQFGRRMVPFEHPIFWPKGGKIKVSVSARVTHNAQDLSLMLYCEDPGSAAGNPIRS